MAFFVMGRGRMVVGKADVRGAPLVQRRANHFLFVLVRVLFAKRANGQSPGNISKPTNRPRE